MELAQQEIRFQFLNSIMKENKVSLKSIYDCMKNNKNDIDTMDRIFDFDNDNELFIRKRFVLLHLISRSRRDKNLEYYRKEKHLDTGPNDFDIQKYKTVIITALMFNNLFFVSACNWCGIIQREVRRENENKIPLYQKNLPDRYQMAATGAYDDFIVFFTDHIDYEKASGTFRFMGDEQQEVYVEYIFDKVQDEIPFILEFCFKIIADKEPIIITIPAEKKYLVRNHDRRIKAIRSDIKEDIDYSRGIINCVLNLIPISDDHS